MPAALANEFGRESERITTVESDYADFPGAPDRITAKALHTLYVAQNRISHDVNAMIHDVGLAQSE